MRASIKNILKYRPTFVMIGLFNIVTFHYAIFRLFSFLYNSSERLTGVSLPEALFINSALILFFSLPHSLLLNAKYKTQFLKYIPQPLYSTFYSLHACLAIILMDNFWASFPGHLYLLNGSAKYLFNGLYVVSWLYMLWAMISTGLFRQSGIEQWYLALKGKSIKNNLAQHGAYQYCRHPIYAAFLAMMWTTPNMSYDHLFLSVTWSIYIFVGMMLKERRLMRNKGYQRYMQVTPALPLLPKILDYYRNKISTPEQAVS